MAKVSMKGVVYAVLPVLLLFQFSSLVAAVDIIFYESTSQCSGLGYSFSGIAGQICCAVSAQDGGSVLVTSTSGSSQASKFYRDGACTTEVASGNGNFCLLGGQFTGAFWYNARRRSLLSDSVTCNCPTAGPTAVVYTDASGTYTLTTPRASVIYSELKSIPDSKKGQWLASQGAVYVAGAPQ